MAQDRLTAILTRPAGRNKVVMNSLLRRGWSVLECPAIDIREVLVDAKAVPRPEQFDLIVFVSRAAVTGYHAQLTAADCPNWPSHSLAACMGPVTASAIRRAFGQTVPILHPDGSCAQDSESLWPILLDLDPPLKKVLIVRGQDGRDWLSQRLRERGVEVSYQQAYRRQETHWPLSMSEHFRFLCTQGVQPTWLLTSPHGVEAIYRNIKSIGLLEWFAACTFILTHERLGPLLSQLLERPVERLSCLLATPEDVVILECFEQITRKDNFFQR